MAVTVVRFRLPSSYSTKGFLLCPYMIPTTTTPPMPVVRVAAPVPVDAPDASTTTNHFC